MKVCHLTSVHPIDDVRIFVKECTSLAAHGFDVTLIACGDTAFEDIKNGVKRISLHVPVKNRLHRMITRSRAVYKKALEVNADVYHFHDPELLLVGYFLIKKKKKAVFDSHEDVPTQILAKTYLQKWLRTVLLFFYNKYESHICKKLTAIVAVTEPIKNRLASLNKNTISVKNYPILKEIDIKNNIKWENKQARLCYVGSISSIRGFYEMIEAIQKTKTAVTLELAGTFHEKGLEKKIIAPPGSSHINYRGQLNRDHVYKLYEESIAGLVILHPTMNYLDSLPVKMFEYMSAGIPVIASNFPLWRQIVEGNECGLCVNPYKPEEIAQAIDFLATNPDVAEQMGKNGQEAVKRKYNWQPEEEKLIRLYKELAIA